MTQDGGNLFPVLPNNNNNAGNPAGAGGSSTAYGTSVGGGSGNAATTAKVDVAAPATATNTVESALSVTAGRSKFGVGFNKSPPPPLPPPHSAPPPQRFKTPDFDISGLRPAVESKRPILLDGG